MCDVCSPTSRTTWEYLWIHHIFFYLSLIIVTVQATSRRYQGMNFFFMFCCFAMNRRPHGSRYVRPHGTAVCPPYMRRGWWLQMSSSAKYWQRYSVGSVVGMWSDLGLADLWCVCLNKIASKNGVKCDPIKRPWLPASSYGRYGAPLPAIKHTTIN